MTSAIPPDPALLRRLNKIGIALSNERNLNALLELILKEARNFTRADAGSLYIREGDFLNCIAAQNESLSRRKKDSRNLFVGLRIPISKQSIAGYAAATGKTVNIADAYRIPPEREYRFDKKSDENRDYRTQSILAVPMKTPEGEVIGVFELFNAMDFSGKISPFRRNLEELIQSMASQAAVSIVNAKLLGDLKSAHLNTILRLSVAAEYRDDDTARHLNRISSGCVILAKRLKLSPEDVELITYASPMHDIGKIGIPDSILHKPGELTPEEYEEIKKHPLIGAKILGGSDLKLFSTAKEIALTHHEKFDGTGYPQGLKGEEIPFAGRIVALADVFDALLSKRPYKPAYPLDKILDIIRRQSGKHFDPVVASAFFNSLDEFLELYRQEGMFPETKLT